MENHLQIKQTADGFDTLYSNIYNQFYHSVLGATNETERVYIELGLRHAFKFFSEVNLLEVGFGTGLGALLSAYEALNNQRLVNYSGIDLHPIDSNLLSKTKLTRIPINSMVNFDLQAISKLEWDKEFQLNNYFIFQKILLDILAFQPDKKFNLVYYDAFAPSSQPELWTEEAFYHIGNLLVDGGILTTYCSKGNVQRNLRSAGFKVEKHAGPPRKREVLRAIFKG